ncbi:GIY-YIG catalytic domain-containing protein [Xylariaceae sp. FL1272]|nr:GIY-YIG catalytic domain-containing protein [Xylariaceae sp. FL1272]
MPVLPKPIPPLYTVYILRSTVHHASLYIGSTPNPPRRLKQHNGEAKGGAARTSRSSLRPWEMIGLVSGFPGMVAALKFEWALNNSHLSLHIPHSSRISHSTSRKRNGAPKRPRHSLSSIMSNVHLLLSVPSFKRWPLRLHFFAPDAHKAWEKWCVGAGTVREGVDVVTDFGPGDEEAERDWGIHGLPLDYAPMTRYVQKTKDLYAFEREGDCVFCHQKLEPDNGLYATCSNADCEGTGHLTCWSRSFLNDENGEDAQEQEVLPVEGRCPNCYGNVAWIDMMREVTLRVRGQKDVDRLLKVRKKRKTRVEDAEEVIVVS